MWTWQRDAQGFGAIMLQIALGRARCGAITAARRATDLASAAEMKGKGLANMGKGNLLQAGVVCNAIFVLGLVRRRSL